MNNIIGSLSLLGYCLFLRRFTRWPIEAAPFLLVSVTIVVLYVFAYMNMLKIGGLAFLILGVLSLVTAPFYLPKNRQELFENYFTPGLAIYIFFMIIFGIMAIYVVNTVAGDDIGRWIPHAKIIYLHQGFIKVTDLVSNPDYPPGSALFYYFLSQFSKFKEENLFFAQLFFLFSPLVILLKPFRWKHWALGCFIFAMVLQLLHNKVFLTFGDAGTLLMDGPTGTFFGGLLTSYILMSEKPKIWLYLLFPAIAMVLFKPMVYAFVVLITTIILIDQLILRLVNKERIFPLFLFLLLMIIPALTLFSWQYHVKQAGMYMSFNLFNVLSDFLRNSSVLSEAEHKIVLAKYHLEFKSTRHFAMTMMKYALIILLFTKDKILRYRIAITHILLLIGILLYSSMLLIFYLYEMDPVAATTLNSYPRFMVVYYIAWIIVVITHAFAVFTQPTLTLLFDKNPLTKIAMFILDEILKPCFNYLQHNLPKVFYIALIILAVDYSKKALQFSKGSYKMFAEQKGFRYVTHTANDIALSIKKKIGNQAKIGIFGDALVPLFTYELIPNSSYGLYDDVGTPEAFKDFVKQFDYLVLANADTLFWKRYGYYFALPERKPFAGLMLCGHSNPYIPWDCVHRLAPIYLYKVETKNGKLVLQNMA